MTRERDFDRLAREWLEQGPNEAPDRVVHAVLQAVERTPQVRRPRWWPLGRPFGMTRMPLLATGVAALLVVAVGGGILLTRPVDERGVGPTVVPATASPSPSPTSSPTPSPSPTVAGPLPASLATRWHGEPRDLPGLGTSQRTRLELTSATLRLAGDRYGSTLLRSDASIPAPGQLRVVSAQEQTGCDTGQAGLYSYSITPLGSRLTLTAIDDACAARSSAMVGTWYGIHCKDAANDCLGVLDAGTYPSQFITPRRDARVNWQPEFGAITYTVPDGWANASDWPRTFELKLSADTATEAPAGAHHGVTVYSQPTAHRQDDICEHGTDSSVPRTVQGLISWLGTVEGIEAGQPTPITIGGAQGQYLDVRLAPGYTGSCPGMPSGTALAVGFTEANDEYEWGIQTGARSRIVLLDLGANDLLLITIDTTDPARFDQLVADAMPIIQSFTFK